MSRLIIDYCKLLHVHPLVPHMHENNKVKWNWRHGWDCPTRQNVEQRRKDDNLLVHMDIYKMSFASEEMSLPRRAEDERFKLFRRRDVKSFILPQIITFCPKTAWYGWTSLIAWMFL